MARPQVSTPKGRATNKKEGYMKTYAVDLAAEPGDLFDACPYRPVGDQSVIVRSGTNRSDWPLRIHGDLATLMALADSLVGACWQLKGQAEEAARLLTPDDPEIAAEG